MASGEAIAQQGSCFQWLSRRLGGRESMMWLTNMSREQGEQVEHVKSVKNKIVYMRNVV